MDHLKLVFISAHTTMSMDMQSHHSQNIHVRISYCVDFTSIPEEFVKYLSNMDQLIKFHVVMKEVQL